jgi:hypothetical protein
MTFEDDQLQYGYVVTREAEGVWWHLHFGRSFVGYHCNLLGRHTNLFAAVQNFGPGVVARSPRYILTLDGEGIDRPEEDLRLDFHWGLDTTDEERLSAARQFQQSVMPLLYESADMRSAVAQVVRHRRYSRLVAPGKLHAI